MWLDGQQANFANFHIVFLLRLTRFLGFYPNLDDYEDGDYFDLRESEFMRNPPVHRDFLHPEEAQKVQLMMRMDFPTMHLFRMSHDDRNRLLEISIKYYRLHLPDFPEMKSIEVLQALYK
jgi:DNA repair protein RecO (recombination protein O)